jgi:hypothetical protein
MTTPPCVICGQPVKPPHRPSRLNKTCGMEACVVASRAQRRAERAARGAVNAPPSAFTWDEMPYDPFTYQNF